MEQPRIGNLVHQAERHQRHRMRVHDAAHVGTRPIDLLVERQFRGRAIRSRHAAVGVHANDVFAAQAAFVQPRGRDPDVAVLFADREVAARRGRHAITIDPLDGLQNLVTRMDEGGGGTHSPIFAEKCRRCPGKACARLPTPIRDATVLRSI